MQKKEKSLIQNFNSDSEHESPKSHFVYIVDEQGISCAFDILKHKLAHVPDNCLTLVYFSASSKMIPLFRDELENLSRRFPQQLLVYYFFCDQALDKDVEEVNQRIFETIINSNLRDVIQFWALGKQGLVEQAWEKLRFLGVEENQIISQIILN